MSAVYFQHVAVQAAAGVPVKIQVGGDFVLSEADLERPLIFVAGGIGITPLMAMLSHYVERVNLRVLQQRLWIMASCIFHVADMWLTKTGHKDMGELGQKSQMGHMGNTPEYWAGVCS